MNILVTGSKGFIGKNLNKLLKTNSAVKNIMEYNRNNSFEELSEFCKKADAVFHLAAVLRPKDISRFDDNIYLTNKLLDNLLKAGNKCPIVFASSIQAELDNPYGNCKRIEEEKFMEYGKGQNANIYIFRFPNLFGPMSKPNYTSVIATFCYNTVKGLPVVVNSPSTQVKFAFVETVLENVIKSVFNNSSEMANKINLVNDFYSVGLGELAYYMETLAKNVEPRISRKDDFYEKLKQTYEWYQDNFNIYNSLEKENSCYE